jgi:hypothetical protein
MSETCILDLDSFQKEKRYILIAREKIFIKKVPAMSTILYEQVIKEGAEMETLEDSKAIMEKAKRAVLIAINYGSEKEYTEEWLYERCEYSDLTKILGAIHAPLKKKAQAEIADS